MDGITVEPGADGTSMQQSIVRAGAPPASDPDPDSDAEVLRIARRNFTRFKGAQSHWEEQAKEELEFLALKHWRDVDKQDRGDKPALVFDLINPTVDTIINKARQNPPSPEVVPVGDKSDKDTAEVLEGLYRNVSADSDGDVAIMVAYEHIVKIGRGAVRQEYEYENDYNFEQKLVIKPIFDPFSVFPDPNCDLRSIHYANNRLRECFEIELLDRSVFEQRYGKKRSDESLRPTISNAYADVIPTEMDGPFWSKEGVIVLTRWWLSTQHENLYELENGDKVKDDQFPLGEDGLPDRKQIVNQRVVEKHTVKYARFTGWELLERGDWPGSWIPIAFGVGSSYYEDGAWKYRGIVRAAMDPNLSYDVMRSRLIEQIGYGSLSQTMASVESLEGLEHIWSGANRKALPFLPIRAFDGKGNPLAPPQRFTTSADISGLVTACQMAQNDVKTVLNSYDDPSLGRVSSDASGRALAMREQGSDNTHFHFFDSLLRMVRQVGRIFIDLVPHIYSEARIININDPDGSQRQVQANAQTMHQGAQKIFDLKGSGGVLRYDVVVKTQGSYASQVDKSRDMIQDYYKTNPAAAQLTGDLYFKMLKIPMGDQFADRLRPPGLPADMNGMPPQAASIIQQSQQAIAQLKAALAQATDENQRQAANNASKEKIAELQAAVTLASKEKDIAMQTLAPVLEAYLQSLLQPPQQVQSQQVAA